MIVIALGWLFVVMVFALAQATAPGGTLLGALITLVLGLAPLALTLWIAAMASRRRRTRRLAASAHDPHRGGHAPGDPVAPVREEP